MNNPISGSTPLNPLSPPVCVEKDYDINFKLSIFESFLLILIAELGDKTFIMLIILQLKTNRITVFVSSLFAELLMNFFAICLGYFIDFLLYKNLVDYIGIMIAFIYGFYLLGASFRQEDISFENELLLNQKSYDATFTDLLDESKAEKKEESLKNSRYPLNEKLETISEVDASKEESKHFQIRKDGRNFAKYESEKIINELNKKEDEINKNDTELIEALNEILDKDKEEEEDTNIDVNAFWTIFRTMVLSEFFDRSQMSTLSMSSIFNFSGVLIGSCLALSLSCYLGVYHGKNIIKILKEKVLSFLLGCIFICYGDQVYIGKKISLK
jgi:putative Ca2+/H+ antiporter (TMEM165/GDT1 family)